MRQKIEIQVFVSCPSDVEPEKELIRGICEDLSDSYRNRNLSLIVRDWRSIVAEFGPRPQSIINDRIKDYDIYFGVFWMRFGTKTGEINLDTGEEFQSGTQEEFYIAYEDYKKNGKPCICLFNKSSDATKKSYENEQLLKVQKFIEEQQSNGWVNSFQSETEFCRKVHKFLNERLLSIDSSENKKQKENLLKEQPAEKRKDFGKDIGTFPFGYISRQLSLLTCDNQLNSTIKSQSIEELIVDKKRIVLLGDAGAGKTIELINLFHTLNASGAKESVIPIYQKLNQYTPESGIEAFLPKFWQEIPEELLLIIWDGLDEIQPRDFNTAVRQIEHFADGHDKIKIIVSCRTNFYDISGSGTLNGFETYKINNLTRGDIELYFDKKYSDSDLADFLRKASNRGIRDFWLRPFFLFILAEYYSQNNGLTDNRAQLFESFLLSRIKYDEQHFKTTVNIREEKHKIPKLLQKVALSMEIICRNWIKESELLKIIKRKEFRLLKYCTAFKKRDGEEEIWEFEHNNIQEYLAAKALSEINFDDVLGLITFPNSKTKVIPSWVNTLSFLFSILDKEDKLFCSLLDWILENQKELIIKFEPDKVPEEKRNHIFQEIFALYKKSDILINSNKFDIRELANFCGSQDSSLFLINELKKEDNSKTTYKNVIDLLSFSKFEDESIKQEVKDLLFNQIEKNADDQHHVHTCIYALKRIGFVEGDTINLLMEKFKNNENEYIRAGIYAILLESDVLEDNIDYLIDGNILINKKESTMRTSGRRLFDERFLLSECLKRVESPGGIQQVLNYLGDSEFDFDYNAEDILCSIFKNAVEAYQKDHSVYECVLNWFLKIHLYHWRGLQNFAIPFFKETNTIEKAFDDIWSGKEDKTNTLISIGSIITEDLMPLIIEKYLSHDLTNKDLDDIHHRMNIVGNQNINKFEQFLQEKTNYRVKRPQTKDYDLIRKKRQQKDFDLLFDGEKFKAEVLRIFQDQGKDYLSFDEIFKLRSMSSNVDEEKIYSESVIVFIRIRIRQSTLVNKNIIIKLLSEKEQEEFQRIYLIHKNLFDSGIKNIEITEEQRGYLVDWCHRNIDNVDFENSIQVSEDGAGGTITTKAIYIWEFSKMFNIDYPENILLSMLSFDFQRNQTNGIEYLIEKLPPDKIAAKMLKNLEKGVEDSHILKNHIEYLSKHKIKNAYSLIMEEIVNSKRQEYCRLEFINIFFNHTTPDCREFLKEGLKKADSEVKWLIIDKLRKLEENDFVIEYLLQELRCGGVLDSLETGKAATELVSLQNLEGLKIYVAWIKNTVKGNIRSEFVSCLNTLENKEALPLLMELLKFSYERKVTVDVLDFDSFNSRVIGALIHLGVVSEENFICVKEALEKFVSQESELYENVKYLRHSIEEMEELFYLNNVPSYNADQARNIVESIQF